MCLVATAALIGGISSASAQVPLGAAAPFTVLGGTAVTCTGGAVVGEVGISPGITASYTNTGCAVKGSAPPANNAAAVEARGDFLSAYAALELKAASWACAQVSGNLAGENLAPGEYCLNGVAKTGLLRIVRCIGRPINHEASDVKPGQEGRRKTAFFIRGACVW
jgi:hypothetical protein